MIALVLTLGLGATAQARGHMDSHRIGAHRSPAAFGALRAVGHDRNIRSGDHFGWRQGDRRT